MIRVLLVLFKLLVPIP